MVKEAIKRIHFGLKPVILLLLIAAGFVYIIPLDEPLWGFAIILIAAVYAAFIVKPIYAIFALLIIRPALDLYSTYINFELTGPPRILIEGNFLFSIISIIFTLLVILVMVIGSRPQDNSLKRLLRSKTFWALVLLIVISAISIVYSIFERPSLLEIGRLISIALYFVVFYLYVANYTKFKELACAIYLAAIIPFFLAFTQLVTGQGVISNIGEQSRIFGTFAHPSHLAIFAFLVFATAVTIFIHEHLIKKHIDKVSLFFAILSAVVLLLTSSRTSLGAILVFLLIIGIAKYRKTLLITLAVLGVFIFLYAPLYERLASVTDNSIYSSGRWRTEYWNDMLTYRVSERPVLGHGTGSAIYVAESLWGFNAGLYSYDPHNDYLLMLMEIGIVGLLIYLAFFTTALYTLGKYFKKFPQERIFILAVIALIIGILIISGLDNVFRGTAIIIVFLSILGGILGYTQKKLSEIDKRA